MISTDADTFADLTEAVARAVDVHTVEHIVAGSHPDWIAEYETWSPQPLAHEDVHLLPWTFYLMTEEQYRRWLATRKAAGLEIDIATCEIDWWYGLDADPYCCGETKLSEEMQQIGRQRFVRSPQSRGWVNEEDLPLEKVEAMYARAHQREYEARQREQAPLAHDDGPYSEDGGAP